MNMEMQRLDTKNIADGSGVDPQVWAECWENCHTATRRDGWNRRTATWKLSHSNTERWLESTYGYVKTVTQQHGDMAGIDVWLRENCHRTTRRDGWNRRMATWKLSHSNKERWLESTYGYVKTVTQQHGEMAGIDVRLRENCHTATRRDGWNRRMATWKLSHSNTERWLESTYGYVKTVHFMQTNAFTAESRL
jgi:hypothetical protein